MENEMLNKDLYKVNTKCHDSVKNNVSCSFCRGVKRCEEYPQDLPKVMAQFNGRWAAEWNSKLQNDNALADFKAAHPKKQRHANNPSNWKDKTGNAKKEEATQAAV